ncbi:hypothetical protein SRB5_70380 [Streptomyces sp. RB5]|uniref:Uncharacterized protein n=1 Tax=Streptomyces smaragdinus TaxID=2585196 RepID=A0A7K0CTL7_9ACTN|nr:hypothetical protein [Streptomyces smaragdinus]
MNVSADGPAATHDPHGPRGTGEARNAGHGGGPDPTDPVTARRDGPGFGRQPNVSPGGRLSRPRRRPAAPPGRWASSQPARAADTAVAGLPCHTTTQRAFSSSTRKDELLPEASPHPPPQPHNCPRTPPTGRQARREAPEGVTTHLPARFANTRTGRASVHQDLHPQTESGRHRPRDGDGHLVTAHGPHQPHPHRRVRTGQETRKPTIRPLVVGPAHPEGGRAGGVASGGHRAGEVPGDARRTAPASQPCPRTRSTSWDVTPHAASALRTAPGRTVIARSTCSSPKVLS